MLDLTLETWKRGGSTVVVVSGEADVAGAPRLRQELVSLLDRGARHLIVDLGAVGVLDSAGLGVLVGVLKRVRGLDGDMVVVCSEPRVRRVFEITRLDRAIDLFSHVDEVPGR